MIRLIDDINNDNNDNIHIKDDNININDSRNDSDYNNTSYEEDFDSDN